MKTKSIKQWLSELDEPYRTNALNNLEQEYADKQMSSPYYALSLAFRWDATLEGWEYWAELSQNLEYSK